MQIVAGGVYTVPDKALSLPPNDKREYHDNRSVVVISGTDTNSDPNWKFVLVCPLSSSTSLKTRFCVKLNQGDGNVAKKCWARLPAVQAVMKSDLKDHWGVLPEEKLELIYGRVVEYMGLLSPAGPNEPIAEQDWPSSSGPTTYGPDEAPF